MLCKNYFGNTEVFTSRKFLMPLRSGGGHAAPEAAVHVRSNVYHHDIKLALFGE